jgi:prepilin-type processing-associated H-X9-DG protein
MKLQLNVTMADGSVETATAVVADFIAWEKFSKRRISDLANGAGITDMAYLAYNYFKRNDPKLPDFDTWIESVDGIEAVDGDDPKATKKAR